ncbi:copper resistance B [Luminiphilus syltensis NOR5-1B]|uniref:Copper resistance B n=1 Tax=Luminiphilus syltensis NOR5-1B TaxID=565045 RepID=B8KSI1_9GAMM|nr:copper resistance protein B [Luminiphilus syltensis]EED35156.1 copper resistance B [Luminiphilus syltensis NOR5-1B]
MSRIPTLPTIGLVLFAVGADAQNAADAFYDAQAMATARSKLQEGHGNQVNSLIIAERLEYSTNDTGDAVVWEGQGWLGTDRNKFWVKTEGEYVDGEEIDEAELQLLYSRAVSAFWDVQAGIRHDFEPTPRRSHLVIGTQGLAPYWFEVDAALFLSDEGKVTARIETEYELSLTQRLILQPRLEINLAASADEEAGIGKGLFDTVAELRLRYEFRREFAPYIGVSWGGDFGDTADMVQRQDGKARGFSIVAGFRLWY